MEELPTEGMGSAGDGPPAAFASQTHSPHCPTPNWELVGHPELSLGEAQRSPEPCDPVTTLELAAASYKYSQALCAGTPQGAKSGGPGCLWVGRQAAKVHCRDALGILRKGCADTARGFTGALLGR